MQYRQHSTSRPQLKSSLSSHHQASSALSARLFFFPRFSVIIIIIDITYSLSSCSLTHSVPLPSPLIPYPSRLFVTHPSPPTFSFTFPLTASSSPPPLSSASTFPSITLLSFTSCPFSSPFLLAPYLSSFVLGILTPSVHTL